MANAAAPEISFWLVIVGFLRPFSIGKTLPRWLQICINISR